MTETREQRVERVYAEAERTLDAMNARRVRRGPEVLIGVLLVLALAVGAVAAVDLSRLMTPRGTALAWTGAAVFGECTAYERLSVAPPGAAADPRPETVRCRALAVRTAPAREQSSAYGIDLLSVTQDGRQANATVQVRRPTGSQSTRLDLVRSGDGWAVVRTEATCRTIGCA